MKSVMTSCRPFTGPTAASRRFVLVVEGSIPDEQLSGEGYWAAVGTDPQTASQSGRTNGSGDWPPKLLPWLAPEHALHTGAFMP